MEKIKDILMRRDGLSEYAADDCIAAAKEDLEHIENFMEYEDFCQDHFGLEPDYMEQLI